MKSRSKKIVHTAKLRPFRAVDRSRAIAEHGCHCHWCGVYTDSSTYAEGSPRATTIDHLYNKLDPRRRGNDDKFVVACDACNQMRARIAEFVFGQRKFPIRHVMPTEAVAVVEPNVQTPIPVAEPPRVNPNPIIRGPRIVRIDPPPTWWSRFKTRLRQAYFDFVRRLKR